ncbi:MAG: L-rhamnose/proton symporter RhaT [Pirellulales bacterium]|nr:L-rhamnose/proton symporter RhaT [Pirellulales bacterium]
MVGAPVPNPFLGVFFHWLGGLASGSFYVPYRGVKKWSWEVYWLVGGFFSWIIAPWILAAAITKDLFIVIGHADPSAIGWAYFWGTMWGFGGLTFGLTMRYLGMSLGMAVALGYCVVFGTLLPPIYAGKFVSDVLQTKSGIVILIGIVVCLFGIAVAGMAGMSKEREMDEEQKKAKIKEFNFRKGILVATFSGIFSASMAFAIAAAEPIAKLSEEHGTDKIWTGLPTLCIILLGGFTSNFIWCAFLNIKNKTGYQYFHSTLRRPTPPRGEEPILENPLDAPSEEMVEQIPRASRNGDDRVPMLSNYLFSALAGVTWYLQFFFYTMGKTQMGAYDFSSWTLHMASIIIFSSLWGIALHEWKGSSKKTKNLLLLGLALLVLSTVIVGYGNYLAPPAVEP